MIGWDTILDVGLECRWYEGNEKNPYDSVFYADCEDLVFNIAKHNLRSY
jgi:hypothetical protein